MADDGSIGVIFVLESSLFYEMLVFSIGKLTKNACLAIQFHSFVHLSGRVAGVPGGSKSGPFRCFGGHFGIAIPMSWAT